MYKKLVSILLLLSTVTMLTGCNDSDSFSRQMEKFSKELPKKPANLYKENFSKNNVYVHLRRLPKKELKKYYDRAETSFYDVYFMAITNKNNKNVILSMPATYARAKNGVKKTVGNNLPKLMNKSQDSGVRKSFTGVGNVLLGLISWGTLPAALSKASGAPKDKCIEMYHQTTYDKGLQSVVLRPYETAAGLFVLNDVPFTSYKSVNFRFQKTQKMEYFEIEYPMYYADGHNAKRIEKEIRKKQKEKLIQVKLKQKKAKDAQKAKQKEYEQQIKEMKNKYKGL